MPDPSAVSSTAPVTVEADPVQDVEQIVAAKLRGGEYGKIAGMISAVLIPAMAWLNSVKTDLADTKTQITLQNAKLDAISVQAAATASEVKSRLDRVDNRLDKFDDWRLSVERQLPGPK